MTYRDMARIMLDERKRLGLVSGPINLGIPKRYNL